MTLCMAAAMGAGDDLDTFAIRIMPCMVAIGPRSPPDYGNQTDQSRSLDRSV
jgi:hypothetical protein